MLKKLTDQHKRWIAFSLGAAIVLLGVSQALFKNDFFVKYRDYIDKFCYWGFIIAAMFIFSIQRSARKAKQESAEETKQLENAEAATEEKKEN